MKKLKIGVIGVGHLGKHHARVYSELPQAELYAVCDIDQNKCTAISNSFNSNALGDYKDLKGKVDAVSISSPTETHYTIAEFFLKNGIHTLVEKPFTKNLREADKLIKLARKNNLTLQVGHIERFNSAYSAVKELSAKPLFIECHRLSPYPNRSLDIGVVLDLMIHDIDIILGLVNSPIKNIDAMGIRVLSKYEDLAHVRIEFRNGCIANLTASRISDERMRKIRLFTDSAYISMDYGKQEVAIYKKENSKISQQLIHIEKTEPLKEEIQTFINCIINKHPSPVCGEEARKSLKVAFQIQKKIWRRKF